MYAECAGIAPCGISRGSPSQSAGGGERRPVPTPSIPLATSSRSRLSADQRGFDADLGRLAIEASKDAPLSAHAGLLGDAGPRAWSPPSRGVGRPRPGLTCGRVDGDLLQESLAGGRLLRQHDLLLGQLLVQLVQLNGGLLQLVQPPLQTLALG